LAFLVQTLYSEVSQPQAVVVAVDTAQLPDFLAALAAARTITKRVLQQPGPDRVFLVRETPEVRRQSRMACHIKALAEAAQELSD
jgi:hypothetical protein